jgi:hypothetical protein
MDRFPVGLCFLRIQQFQYHLVRQEDDEVLLHVLVPVFQGYHPLMHTVLIVAVGGVHDDGILGYSHHISFAVPLGEVNIPFLGKSSTG